MSHMPAPHKFSIGLLSRLCTDLDRESVDVSFYAVVRDIFIKK